MVWLVSCGFLWLCGCIYLAVIFLENNPPVIRQPSDPPHRGESKAGYEVHDFGEMTEHMGGGAD